MKKRILSLLFAVVMILNLFPVNALADDDDIRFTSGSLTYELDQDDDGNEASLERCSTSASGTITIPSTVTKAGITYKVNSIEEGALKNCTGITAVIIPSSIKEIDDAAFAGCTKLTRITFKGNVPEIEEDAFKNVTATVIYPANNSTWTSKVKKNYGGTLTWTTASSSSYDTNDLKIKYLARPTVNVSNTKSGVYVKWNKISGASGYYVYRKASSNASWTKVATIKKAATVTWTDTKASNGKKYIYTVKAYNGSTASAYISGKTIYRLSVPKLESLKNQSGLKMKVEWTENEKSSGYQLQYAANSKFKNAVSVLVNDEDDDDKVIKNLKKGTTYYVRIRAFKKSGDVKYYSSWSSAKSVKITK